MYGLIDRQLDSRQTDRLKEFTYIMYMWGLLRLAPMRNILIRDSSRKTKEHFCLP